MLREIISNDWLTILIVLSICILALIKVLFPKRFNDFLWVVINSKYLKIYFRDQKFIHPFEGLLFLNLLISLGIFLFISYNTLVEFVAFNIGLLLNYFLGIGLFILVKLLIERIIGWLFEIGILINTYVYQKINYKNLIGLMLLPINILLIFVVKPTNAIIYFVIGLILLISFIGFTTSFKMHQRIIKNNLFYFILYLCALEIVPYLILYTFLF